jgi:ribonuclease HI
MGETLSYAPRKAIKSQVLADFLAEWTDTQLPPVQLQAELWTMYFDGLLMKTGAGAGLLFISPHGVHMCYIIRLHFPASNNIAEYDALVMGLRITVKLGVRHLNVRGDSQLVIDQVMKSSSCHDPKMEAYCEEVQRLEDKFHGLELNHIARKYNEATDELTKITSSRTTVPPDALQTIPITWSFAVWGLNLVGPLKRTTGGFTHLLVAIDKFSKWIEAHPITSIRSEQAVLFLLTSSTALGFLTASSWTMAPNSLVKSF